MIDDEKRISGLLELASQRMKRFRELEEIEWKLNFSIWALLGGLAYVWVTGHVTVPEWLKSPCAFIVMPIAAMLPHAVALIMLHKQEQTEAKSRNHYRDQAERLVSEAIPKEKFRYLGCLRRRDWIWIGWELFVTSILAESVLILIRTPRCSP